MRSFRKLLSAQCLILCALLVFCSCSRTEDPTTAPYSFTPRTETSPPATQAPETELPTEPTPTEAPTEPPTEAPTEPETQPVQYSELVVQLPIPLDNELSARADEICREHGAVGAQAVVIRDGYVFDSYQYGQAISEVGVTVVENTKFRVASLSKFITCTVFMALREDGYVSEYDDISVYFGRMIRNPNFPDTPITPEMLMTHTASFADGSVFRTGRNGDRSVTLKDVLDSGTSWSKNEPGTVYSYSNLGTAVLGAVCELASGLSFNYLAAKYIFAPLGIDASYTASNLVGLYLLASLYGSNDYTVDKQLASAFSPQLGTTYDLVQGNLTISAKDYAQILCSIMKTARSGVREIVSADTASELLKMHFEQRIGYGITRSETLIEGETVLTHGGNYYGMLSVYAIDPQTCDGVVILTTGASDTTDPDGNKQQICTELARLLWPDD